MGQLDSGNLNFHVGTLTRGGDFGSGSFFFALNFARRFIFPEPLEGRMAQQLVFGPTGERYFADELGLYPVDTFGLPTWQRFGKG